MNSPLKRAGKKPLTVRELVTLSAFAALMAAGQVAMAPLPNIEPVSMLIIACALVYGVKSLFAVYAFVAVEALIYGMGLWVINYMYVWAVLAAAAILLRRIEGRIFWAFVSGIFGLSFGALCAIPYFFIGGVKMAVSYWVAGIAFDLMHAAGNFAVALALLQPCVKVLKRLKSGQGHGH